MLMWALERLGAVPLSLLACHWSQGTWPCKLGVNDPFLVEFRYQDPGVQTVPSSYPCGGLGIL